MQYTWKRNWHGQPVVGRYEIRQQANWVTRMLLPRYKWVPISRHTKKGAMLRVKALNRQIFYTLNPGWQTTHAQARANTKWRIW